MTGRSARRLQQLEDEALRLIDATHLSIAASRNRLMRSSVVSGGVKTGEPTPAPRVRPRLLRSKEEIRFQARNAAATARKLREAAEATVGSSRRAVDEARRLTGRLTGRSPLAGP